MTTQTQEQKNLAVLVDNVANVATNPITRPMMGIQQFMLLNAQEHCCIPIFLQRNNGNIGYYYLMKAMVADTATNEVQRMLQVCWLLIPANPQVSMDKQKLYFADRNHGFVHMHNKMLAMAGKSAFNSVIAQVTMRNMPIVPNKKAQFKWATEIWPRLNEQHDVLCGTDVNVPVMRKTPEFENFMKTGNKRTHELFLALYKKGMTESNTVFEVMPDSMCFNNSMFYGDKHTDAIIDKQSNGVNKPTTVSCWNGVFRGDISITSTINGLGQTLKHGMREVGEGNKAKHGVDVVGKIFDRVTNYVEGRVTCIDPVTIAYLNGNNKGDEEDYSSSQTKKSRAETLFSTFESNEHIQINNAELKLHANGKDADSMKVSWELRINDNSTYQGLRDVSKLGTVNTASDEGLFELIMAGEELANEVDNIETEEEDFSAILAQTNDLQKKEEDKKDKTTAPNQGTVDIDDDLPF